MEINDCNELRNIFISDFVLYQYKLSIAVSIAILVYLILEKSKLVIPRASIILGIVSGVIYYLLIDNVLHFYVECNMNKRQRRVKQEIADSMVRNCNFISKSYCE